MTIAVGERIEDASRQMSEAQSAEGGGRGTALSEVEGRLMRSVYHDAESRYSVLRVQLEGELAGVTLVGRHRAIEEGAKLRAWGHWGAHPTHGRQFEFERIEVQRPTTEAGILRRLLRYPGVREVMAQRIFDTFGELTLDVLDKQPERLLEVEGIGQKTMERIVEFHSSRVGPLAVLENRLIELDMSPRLAERLFRRYGEAAKDMLEGQPYRLSREVKGIGFATADRIARALGVGLDAPERIDAGLVHAFERAERDGHCALPLAELMRIGMQLLGRPPDELQGGIERLLEAGDLVLEGEGERALCFVREYLQAELGVAQALVEMASAAHEQWTLSALPDHLSEGQVEAVEAVAAHGVVVLTGGPGTGKSTVVRNVIELALRHDQELLLCAPTGRAAKRLEQATGQEAKTVHRLLEIQGESGEFFYNANNPLPVGLVVVDESSMLDLALAEALFTAMTPEHRLLLVGDADQLPSVGPGNVLRDIIEAASREGSPIPVVRLARIFRQADGSSIIENAHRILQGETLVSDAAGAGGQFFFTRASEAQRAHEVIVKLAAERIPEVYGLDPVDEVQILCPMHKGQAGTDAFNAALQDIYTAGAPEYSLPSLTRGPHRRFRVGDRVMQTRNDYQRSVFNGDIGKVTHVDPDAGEVIVEIDGAAVRYEPKELGALRLAYAISIHKSQGSEFPAILIPLLTEHHVMLRRNLLYTAITRAKQLCLLVGDPRAVDRAIARADAARRHTGLRRRIEGVVSELGGALVVEAL